MSTRSNVIVNDDYTSIQLYRHSDGYPDGKWGVLATLEQALEFAWPLPRFDASDFAAAIVRAWKESRGNIYIDGTPEGWNLIHGDTEWVYVIQQEVGGVLVRVYDWHRYWLGQGDPVKDPPTPVLVVPLAEAKEAGLNWTVVD